MARKEDYSWLGEIDIRASTKRVSILKLDCPDTKYCKGGDLCVQDSRWKRHMREGKVTGLDLFYLAKDCADLCPQVFGIALKIAQEKHLGIRSRFPVKSIEELQEELLVVEEEIAQIPIGKRHRSRQNVVRTNLQARIANRRRQEKSRDEAE